jgi:hypothetical protein
MGITLGSRDRRPTRGNPPSLPGTARVYAGGSGAEANRWASSERERTPSFA